MTTRTIVRIVITGFVLCAFLVAPIGAVQPQAEKSPAFSLQNPAGDTLHLAAYIGRKPILLVFWATWCPLCKDAVPHLNRIDAAGKAQIIAINVEERRSKVSSFMAKNNPTYPVVLDSDGATAKAFHVPGVPAYVLIDTAGSIVYRGESFPESINVDAVKK